MDMIRDRRIDHGTDIAAHEATYRTFVKLVRTAGIGIGVILLGLTLLV